MYLRADTIEPAFAIVTFEAPEGPAADPSIQNVLGYAFSLPTRSAHGSATSKRTCRPKKVKPRPRAR